MKSRVLFICTGNYYRSRCAEALFNHRAEALGLPWQAFSRGLAIHLLPPEFVLSPQTEEYLAGRQIELRHTAADRRQLSEEDLTGAEVIIALKDDEHRPMMRTMFPAWVERVVFWDVGDQPEVRPEDGLPEIERQVLALIEELGGADDDELAA
jgi:protein-tyrosine phosphatase